MVEYEAKVLDIIKRVPGIKSFRFNRREDADFIAGQYFGLTLNVNGREITKPFSFSSSPTEKTHLEFTKRLTDSDFSGALNRMKTGDRVRLRMAFGTFTLRGESERVTFLVGGIGITPVRSICKFVNDRGLSTDMVVIYGNRNKDSIVFKDELDRIQAVNKSLRVIYTLSDPEIVQEVPGCKEGHIDENMIQEHIPDYQQRIFYSCGPPNMVECLRVLLRDRLAIAPDRIRIENFTGY